MNKKLKKTSSRKTLAFALASLSMANGQAIAQSEVTESLEQSTTDGNPASQLEVIEVTAQRRGQSILEVPVAITSISAAMLEKKQVDDIFDLMLASPSVSGIASGGLSAPLSNTPLRIRGVGTSGVNPGFESAVGMYVDEVYRSRPAVAMLSFYDMQGIDILRGPQGTLFGKNSTAGAITQRTAKPDLSGFDAYALLQYASFNSLRAEGAMNIATSDDSALRISALHNSTDGFYTQAVTNDDTIAESETQGVRVQYAIVPNDELYIRLTADWMSFADSSNYARATRFDNNDPNGLGNTAFPALALNTAIGGLGYYYWDAVPGGVGAGEPSPYDYVSGVNKKGLTEMDQHGLAAHISYDISEKVVFRSISAFRSVESQSANGDWDFGPSAIAGSLEQAHEFDTFSQEFLFSFDYEDFDIVSGIHYFREDIGFERLLNLGIAHGIIAGGSPGDPVRANPNVNLQDVRFEQEEDSIGIFAHLTYELSDELTFIGGMRWNKVNKDVSYINQFGSAIEYHDAVANNLRFYYGRPQAATAFPWALGRSDKELTYDVALQWRPTEQTQLYGKFSHGFKAGGFSMNVNSGTGLPDPNGELVIDGRTFTQFTPENSEFSPEFVDTFELGARWNSSLGLISAAFFTSDFTDLQLTTFEGEAFVARSVGSIDVQGFEFESALYLTDDLSLTAAFTLLDTELGDDVIGVPIGRSVAQAPDFAAAVGLDYTRDLSNGMVLTATANINYQSESFLNDGGPCTNTNGDIVPFSECDPSIFNNQISLQQQDAYYVVNATIGLSITDNYDLAIYCDNCLEEEYQVYAFNQPANPGSIVGYAGAPRVFGARMKYRF